MHNPPEQSPARSSLVALGAAVAFIASALLTFDMLLGALSAGSHLDAVLTGPALLGVNILGLVVYFALVLTAALMIRSVGRCKRAGLDTTDMWGPSIVIPLVGIVIVFVGLGVGDAVPGGVGSRVVTALLVGGIAIVGGTVGWVRTSASKAPGRLALTGVLVVLTALAAIQAVGLFDFGIGTRKDRLVQVPLAATWAIACALFCLVNRVERPHLQPPSLRRLLVATLIFAAIPGLLPIGYEFARGKPQGSEGPNVVLIVFDAMRADRLSLHGGRVPTPHFETLAKDGVVFEQARAQAPHTVPSMTSLFSSLYPGQLTVTGETGILAEYRIPGTHKSLAEVMADRGYATCAISANYSLDQHTGILEGFSEHVVFHHGLRTRNVFSQVLPGLEAIVQLVARRPESASLMDSSQVVLRVLRRFLRRYRDGPFFVWVQFMDPHDPYAPPTRYRSDVVRSKGRWPVFAPHDPSVGTPTEGQIRSGHVSLSPTDRQYISELYDAEIAYADDLLGQVRTLVEQASGERSVIYCVTADHGEEFWDHGDYYHGHTLYDELVHVPLVIVAPGAGRGLRVPESVAGVDVAPTLLDLCGLAVPPEYEGRTLTRSITHGAPLAPAPVFSDATAYYGPAEAITADGYKLIRNLTDNGLELFDLATDPGEQDDLATQRPEVTTRLSDALSEWHTTVHATSGRQSVAGQKEHIERLKSLGYL